MINGQSGLIILHFVVGVVFHTNDYLPIFCTDLQVFLIRIPMPPIDNCYLYYFFFSEKFILYHVYNGRANIQRDVVNTVFTKQSLIPMYTPEASFRYDVLAKVANCQLIIAVRRACISEWEIRGWKRVIPQLSLWFKLQNRKFPRSWRSKSSSSDFRSLDQICPLWHIFCGKECERCFEFAI